MVRAGFCRLFGVYQPPSAQSCAATAGLNTVPLFRARPSKPRISVLYPVSLSNPRRMNKKDVRHVIFRASPRCPPSRPNVIHAEIPEFRPAQMCATLAHHRLLDEETSHLSSVQCALARRILRRPCLHHHDLIPTSDPLGPRIDVQPARSACHAGLSALARRPPATTGTNHYGPHPTSASASLLQTCPGTSFQKKSGMYVQEIIGRHRRQRKPPSAQAWAASKRARLRPRYPKPPPPTARRGIVRAMCGQAVSPRFRSPPRGRARRCLKISQAAKSLLQYFAAGFSKTRRRPTSACLQSHYEAARPLSCLGKL